MDFCSFFVCFIRWYSEAFGARNPAVGVVRYRDAGCSELQRQRCVVGVHQQLPENRDGLWTGLLQCLLDRWANGEECIMCSVIDTCVWLQFITHITVLLKNILIVLVVSWFFFTSRTVNQFVGSNIARLMLWFMLLSTGMFISCAAFLPSSFSMYLTMVAVAGWISGNNKVGTHACQRLCGVEMGWTVLCCLPSFLLHVSDHGGCH